MKAPRHGVWVVVAVVAVVAVVGVALLRLAPQGAVSSTTPETSCDVVNLFAAGATSLPATFRMRVHIPDAELIELREVLKAFADLHDWTFRDLSMSRPGVETFTYYACDSTHALMAVVNEQRWGIDPDPSQPSPPRREGIHIFLYGDGPDSAWQSPAARIVDALEARWPGAVKFIDGVGSEVDRPEFLGDARVPARE